MAPGIRPLSPRLEEVARKEINEDPKRIEQDLTYIKEWLKKQPHLNARTDDQWLLTFLRGCKFNLERTKEKLDTYYTMRTLLPEIFSNRDPMLPEIQDLLKLGTHLPLPQLDEQGRRIVVTRIGQTDLSTFKIETAMKLNFMIMDIMLHEDDDYVISGDVGLMDFTDVSLAHMIQFTPSLSKKMSTIYQEGYPIRPRGINYIHLPSSFYTVFNLMQTFLKEKLKKKLHVHGEDMASLYKQIPQINLPSEYGGDGGSLVELAAVWKKKMESHRDWFLEDEKYKSNEKKRIGKPKTQEDMFGLESSFGQLSFD